MLRLQRIKRINRSNSTNTDVGTEVSSTQNIQKEVITTNNALVHDTKYPKSTENIEIKENTKCTYKRRSDLTPGQLAACRKRDAVMKRVKRANETDIERAIRRAKVAQRARERRQKEAVSSNNVLKKAGLKFFMHLAERTDLKSDPNSKDPLAFTDEIQNEKDVPDPKSESSSLLKDVTIIRLENDSTLVPIIKEENIKEVESQKEQHEDGFNPADGKNLVDISSVQEDSYEKSTKVNKKCFTARKEKTNKSVPHKCTMCNKVLTTKGNMKMHMVKRHGLKRIFKCKICNASFDFLRQVVRHRDVHRRTSDGMFQCDKCGKVTLEHHNFLTHLKIHAKPSLKKVKEFVCDLCGNIFKRSDGLRNHKLLIHRIDGGTKAEKYKEKHYIKKHVCNICGKRFAFKCLLQDHTNIHSGSKPYLCSKCGKSFTQKPSLKQHAKTHGIRSFKCLLCDNAFHNHGDLKKHMRTHTGERPYVCELCGETYSQSSHLSVHRRSHTGERPFTCDTCGRGFTKSSDLVRHRRIHTGELPYLCQVCGKGFRQSAQCANHIKIRHPDATVILS